MEQETVFEIGVFGFHPLHVLFEVLDVLSSGEPALVKRKPIYGI